MNDAAHEQIPWPGGYGDGCCASEHITLPIRQFKSATYRPMTEGAACGVRTVYTGRAAVACSASNGEPGKPFSRVSSVNGYCRTLPPSRAYSIAASADMTRTRGCGCERNRATHTSANTAPPPARRAAPRWPREVSCTPHRRQPPSCSGRSGQPSRNSAQHRRKVRRPDPFDPEGMLGSTRANVS